MSSSKTKIDKPTKDEHIVAVIVAAGNGSRMQAITKGGAKELVDVHEGVPSIGYSVLEALKNGIKNIVIVSNKAKTDLEDWLNGSEVGANGKEIFSLSQVLEMAGNPNDINIDIVYQEIPLGLGHAVLAAKKSTLLQDHNGRVYVLLPDEVFVQTENPGIDNIGDLEFLQMMLEVDHSVILTMQVQPEDRGRYGIAVTNPDGLVELFFEKPTPADKIESNEAIAGRYLLSMDIFNQLEAGLQKLFASIDEGSRTILKKKLCNAIKTLALGDDVDPKLKARVLSNLKQILKVEINGKAIGELQLTDSIQALLEAGENMAIVSLPENCLRLDIGTAEGYETAQREIENLQPVVSVVADQAPLTRND